MYDELIFRLRRYSKNCIANKLDADFADAVQQAAEVIENLQTYRNVSVVTIDEPVVYEPAPYWTNPNWKASNVTCAIADMVEEWITNEKGEKT